jgi:hypothetical protein
MATFVHITREATVPAIRRSGIAMSRMWPEFAPDRGVFCIPVVRDFFTTHQWMRELRREGGQTRVGIYFRIPDDQVVHAARYNGKPKAMTAAKAVALAATAGYGFQVIVPRAIAKREIFRVKHLPQVTGWRVYPAAKGTMPTWFPPGGWGARRRQKAMDDAREREDARYFGRFPQEWYGDE